MYPKVHFYPQVIHNYNLNIFYNISHKKMPKNQHFAKYYYINPILIL